MRNIAAWATLVFIAVLAYVIGIHLDETAMAVVIGVIVGMLAGVTAGMFVVWQVASRGHDGGASEVPPETERHRVVYIVMNPEEARDLLASLNGGAHVLRLEQREV